MSEGERARWLFQSAAAATPRSSLELLNLRFPFSQLGLMSAHEFAKQAERRRSKGLRSRPAISRQVLEELHRHGVLIPLFRVDLTEGEPMPFQGCTYAARCVRPPVPVSHAP